MIQRGGPVLRDQVNPRIGNVPLQKLTAAHLDALYAELLTKGRRDGTGGLSPRTVRYVHTVIRAALQTGFRWGRITHNPADRSEPPESVRSEARHWTTDKLRRFLAHVEGDRLASLYQLAAMTGIRMGESLGLRWRDLDLEAQTLKVNQALVVVDGHSMLTTRKTDAGRRTVALDPRTIGVLRTHRKAQMAERLTAGPDGPIGRSSVRITADSYQHVEQAKDQDAAIRTAVLVLG